MVFIKTYNLPTNWKRITVAFFVLLICNKDIIMTTVYGKPTNSDIYLN